MGKRLCDAARLDLQNCAGGLVCAATLTGRSPADSQEVRRLPHRILARILAVCFLPSLECVHVSSPHRSLMPPHPHHFSWPSHPRLGAQLLPAPPWYHQLHRFCVVNSHVGAYGPRLAGNSLFHRTFCKRGELVRLSTRRPPEDGSALAAPPFHCFKRSIHTLQYSLLQDSRKCNHPT